MSSENEQVTLAQAAAAAGVHLNTVKNWRRVGELRTAVKVFEKGIEVWYVELSEVLNLAAQKKANRVANKPDNNNQTGDYPTADPVQPNVENTLSLIRESVVRPLTELVEKQTNTIQELSQEVGQLKERVNQLTARLEEKQEASQNVTRQATEAQEASEETKDKVIGQKPKRWWQR